MIDLTDDHPFVAEVIAVLFNEGCRNEMTCDQMVKVVKEKIPALSELRVSDVFGAMRRRCATEEAYAASRVWNSQENRRQIQIQKPKPKSEATADVA